MRVPQKPDYEIVITTDSYTGNFERELIGNILGILDCVQMEIDYASEYRENFFQEEGLTFEDSETLLDDYLFETHQEVDDWEQMTFYHMAGDDLCSLNIQICKPLDAVWKERIIRRAKEFFDFKYQKIEDEEWQRQFGHDAPTKNIKLISICLIDKDGKVLEKWY